MDTITSVLTEDHRHADDLLAAAREQAVQGDWQTCAQQLARFRTSLESHMRVEEEVLFPAFEQATGSVAGPTGVMRHEHHQLLRALDEIRGACVSRATERFELLAKAFTMVLNMHSAKEETVLYPMCDRVVETMDGSAVWERLQRFRAVARLF